MQSFSALAACFNYLGRHLKVLMPRLHLKSIILETLEMGPKHQYFFFFFKKGLFFLSLFNIFCALSLFSFFFFSFGLATIFLKLPQVIPMCGLG